MLRFYFETARATFRRLLIYRWANLAGLTTNIFFGVITSYIFLALYHTRPIVNGYDVRAALRYLWLVQSLVMVVLPFTDTELMLTIRTGEVVSDLAKPCDFYGYWFARFAGRSAYYLLFRMLPCYAAGMLLFGIGLPSGAAVWPAFALSILLAAPAGYAYRFLYNLAAFWVIEARAVSSMAGVIAQFFAGLYVPLPFFPPAVRQVLDWLPFSAMLNTSSEIFAGQLTGGPLALAFLRQVFWLAALTLAARGLLAQATRRVVIQGG